MLRDLERQESVHRPGPFWQGYARRIEQSLRREGLARFRSSAAIGKGFADVAVTDPIEILDPGWRRRSFELLRSLPLVRSLVYRYRWLVKRDLDRLQRYKELYLNAELGDWLVELGRRHELPETRVGSPGSTIATPVGEIGEQYLRMFAWIDDLSRHVALDRVCTVLEIGGGFGAMSHSLLHLFPGIRTLVYLDIPPLLYVGTQYLRYFFGDQVEDYRALRSATEIGLAPAGRRRILAIAPWQLPRVAGEIDLVWNSSSFQEMTPETVRFYAAEIHRLLAGDGRLGLYVYSARQRDTTLQPEELVQLVASASGLEIDPVDSPVAGTVVPGRAFLGRRPAAAG